MKRVFLFGLFGLSVAINIPETFSDNSYTWPKADIESAISGSKGARKDFYNQGIRYENKRPVPDRELFKPPGAKTSYSNLKELDLPTPGRSDRGAYRVILNGKNKFVGIAKHEQGNNFVKVYPPATEPVSRLCKKAAVNCVGRGDWAVVDRLRHNQRLESKALQASKVQKIRRVAKPATKLVSAIRDQPLVKRVVGNPFVEQRARRLLRGSVKAGLRSVEAAHRLSNAFGKFPKKFVFGFEFFAEQLFSQGLGPNGEYWVPVVEFEDFAV
ncbi:hypothetical protein HIM_07204 [Hirsutella minnesotensis 3608]|uniref:Uncharacterized protein n=1 Tax=Hirsutella minnesotensis 3608 TaxID=1043627 RepID=A0A0F7ZNA5_9HYPO|nr:hypothetical protein HIM_07204 [Hirsutella minnesotensis 3608]